MKMHKVAISMAGKSNLKSNLGSNASKAAAESSPLALLTRRPAFGHRQE